MESFGHLVRGLLADQRLTATELGNRMGLTRQAVSTMLSDRNSPTLGRIREVANALNVSVAYLLATAEERQRLTPGAPALTRPPDQIPAQERLQAAAAMLNDAEAATVLHIAEGLLLERAKAATLSKKSS